MKSVIALFAATLLVGCSSGWQDYKQANACVATDQTMKKSELIQIQGTTLATGAPTAVSIPSVRIKTYRRFDCSNGSIWGPV